MRMWRAAMISACLSAYAFRVYPQVRSQNRIYADVELVQIPVIAFDDKGGIATGLQRADFRLFEDGVEQRILYFERERVPVSFVILADLSSSMTRKMPFVREASLSLLDPDEEARPYADEYSLVSIGKRPQQMLRFTRDKPELERRLPLLLSATNESTALFDATWLGANVARDEAANARRALIIITDGGDNHSRYNLQETRRFLEEADVPVFAVMAGPSFELPEILLPSQKKPQRSPSGKASKPQLPNFPFGFGDDNYVGPAEQRGPHNMKILTEATGGAVFTARREEDLPRIVRTIGLALRYEYVLTYRPEHLTVLTNTPENIPSASVEHRILVQLHPKEKFKGYSTPYYKHTYRTIE